MTGAELGMCMGWGAHSHGHCRVAREDELAWLCGAQVSEAEGQYDVLGDEIVLPRSNRSNDSSCQQPPLEQLARPYIPSTHTCSLTHSSPPFAPPPPLPPQTSPQTPPLSTPPTITTLTITTTTTVTVTLTTTTATLTNTTTSTSTRVAVRWQKFLIKACKGQS